MPLPAKLAPEQRRELFFLVSRARGALTRLHPALVVTIRRGTAFGGTSPRLRDPGDPEQPGAPVLSVASAELSAVFKSLPGGETKAVARVGLAPPKKLSDCATWRPCCAARIPS